jgi:uncharacterized protein (DUF2147 family)
MTSIASRATAATLALAGTIFAVGAAHAAEPFGTWLTEDGRARVRTDHCGADGAHLCGYIVWGSKPLDETGKPKIDKYNPDPKKQARPQLGHQMMLGLKLNGEGRYEGKIYNADDGRSYDVTVWSEQPGTLTVKGCMLVFCASQSWKRVADLAPGQLQGPTDGPGGPRSDPEWVVKPAGATTRKLPAAGGTPQGAR